MEYEIVYAHLELVLKRTVAHQEANQLLSTDGNLEQVTPKRARSAVHQACLGYLQKQAKHQPTSCKEIISD